jgi:hypothetical protein
MQPGMKSSTEAQAYLWYVEHRNGDFARDAQFGVNRLVFVFVQGHLLSSQLFVFWIVFVFVYPEPIKEPGRARQNVLKTSDLISRMYGKYFCDLKNHRIPYCLSKVERLMCEVEFWEVF